MREGAKLGSEEVIMSSGCAPGPREAGRSRDGPTSRSISAKRRSRSIQPSSGSAASPSLLLVSERPSSRSGLSSPELTLPSRRPASRSSSAAPRPPGDRGCAARTSAAARSARSLARCGDSSEGGRS